MPFFERITQSLRTGAGRPGGHELPDGMVFFTREQRKKFERMDYAIYTLPGMTIAQMRINYKMPIPSTNFEIKASIASQVAIPKRGASLPGSNGQTLDQQNNLIRTYEKFIASIVPNTMAIKGTASDWIGLCAVHYEVTGEYLRLVNYPLENKPLLMYTDTMVRGQSVLLEDPQTRGGINLLGLNPENFQANVFVGAIVIPTRSY